MKKSRKIISLEKYGLSKNRKKELRAFCLQYNEWLDEKNALYNSIGGKTGGDVTASNAIKIISLNENIDLVEQTAAEAGADIYKYVLQNVTEGISYEYMDVPCGRRQFYNMIKYFFILLDKKKMNKK